MKTNTKQYSILSQLIITCLLLVSFCSTLFLLTPNTYAADCNGTKTSIITCEKSKDGKEVEGVWSILLMIINVLTAGVGIAAVGGIVYGAVLYTSAGDNESQVSKAKETIRNTIIGVVCFIAMFSFLQYIIPGGIFGTDSPLLASTKAPSKTRPPTTTPSTTGSAAPIAPTTKTLPTIKNFRDAAASNSVLKKGVLYRSVDLSSISQANVKSLSNLLDDGIIIDLRQASQRSKSPDKNIPGADHTNIPITATLDYTNFVTKASDRRAFGETLTTIANAPGDILIHCAAGKDRTGWAVAMVMYALGANNQQVMTEYMKSAPSGEVKRTWLNAGLSKARAQYGSIDNYLKKGLGLSNATLSKLRQKLGA